jgi:hypothetical protein
MNKLVLIGNGFDLAHGLPTSYKDFINHFWENINSKHETELYKNFIFLNPEFRGFLEEAEIVGFKSFLNQLKRYSQKYSIGTGRVKPFSTDEKDIFYFVNDFLRSVVMKQHIQNWVDIENEYYQSLKKIVGQQKTKVIDTLETDEQFAKRKKREVLKLNEEFDQVKKLLENYLFRKVSEYYHFDKVVDNKGDDFREILEILSPFITRNELSVEKKLERLSNEFVERKDRIDLMSNSRKYLLNPVEVSDRFNSFLLSFNYTHTASSYKHFIELFSRDESIICNYIHGSLYDNKNPINFGFGDEIDKDYEQIENIIDNEYLRNFKSFQYANTSNYSNLLKYIDSEKFQVCILGHSCGLSDRVLLNTIFEHENCRSIKVYYHQKEDGIDNYTDIVQNISRHFKDKALMRRKLVNKTLSSPLPQTVRLVKKKA